MKISTMSIESNKENIPPVYTNVENNKNSIHLITSSSSFKKNSKRKMKRVPLADITNLFENSSTLTREENSVSSVLPSSSIVFRLNSRRRALRIGFR
jgi:secreted trypsin-like serine protease